MEISVDKEYFESLKVAEKSISDAYIRIRVLVDAFDTSYAGEDRFEVTENKIKGLINANAALQERIKVLDQEKAKHEECLMWTPASVLHTIDALQAAKLTAEREREELKEQAHYATGVAELAMKHRDEAERALPSLQQQIAGVVTEMRVVVRDASGSISKLTVAHYADRLADLLTSLTAEVVEQEYMQHLPTCAIEQWFDTSGIVTRPKPDCTCGLASLLLQISSKIQKSISNFLTIDKETAHQLLNYFMSCGYIDYEQHEPTHKFIKQLQEFIEK